MSHTHDDGNDHGHSHGHPHSHPHSEATPRGGSVVVDIGGDVGALVVYVDDDLAGTEIPIEWEHDPAKDVHTGVWPRRVGAGSITAAVYPALQQGRYRIPAIKDREASVVEVAGGAVLEVDARTRQSVLV